MELNGRVLVLIRLADDEQPVSVLESEDTQASSTRVVSVPRNMTLDEVLTQQLKNDDAFDSVVTYCEGAHDVGSTTAVVAKYMRDDSVLNLYVADATDEQEGAVLMALMMGGFVDTSAEREVVLYPGISNARMFSAKKAATVAEVASVSVKTTTTATKKWTVLADDVAEEEDEDMIDEDDLLDDTDEVLKAAKDDCGVGKDGKRRACKNCSCGRKDMEEEEAAKIDVAQQVSSCGNCSKGDAFRCGTCPFLGKPAFEPGMERVMLHLDDTDDV